ncbi:glycosyltransferase family 4 protein [Cyanobium sp. Morenito 9A2]|uniref:glycosyltransferase family 4 protein n=1 Tax=Cyanobium sp. Morenito 9A2 TaxID=2823718 RepID=UPI0020CFD848|nr:glycosyltransferase family 4 protein [Cyanobium sp. Morenito 9A2]MCP9849802.1 glycosyltransferase family 4 protein [Cyanobium sp. Morenito 9A2]
MRGLRRLSAQLRQRWSWRASRSRTARLTVVSQFFPPDFAATGQLLDDLSVRLAQRGLQVQVVTGQPAYAFHQKEAPQLEFHSNRCIRRTRASRLWPRRIRGRAVNGLLFCLRSSARLLRYARRGDLLLYTTEPPYLPVVGWLLHRLTRTPYLVLLYDLYPDVLVELKVLPERHGLTRVWRELNRWVFAEAQELIVLSASMAERLRRFCPEAAAKVSVIPSWADPERIQPLAKADNWFARKHGLEPLFTVLYSGNQGRCHDLVTLMAAALLLRHDRRIRFLFIGSGPQRERLIGLINDWGLLNCRFLPFQSLEVLPYSLTCADLAVVSLGIGAEGLVAPSKLYGHLAAATPIAAITPEGSELQQLVRSSGCGAWFANGDADGLARWIRHLADHPEEAQRQGKAARGLLLAEASPERITDQYWELIRRHLPFEKLVAIENTRRLDAEPEGWADLPRDIGPQEPGAVTC